jgi:hypothetical protein
MRTATRAVWRSRRGTISAWAWGASRIVDYLEKDGSIDPAQIALFGHSRLGKAALWASALDTRIAAVYSSCAGEMGSALARRVRCSSPAARPISGPIRWVSSWRRSRRDRSTACSAGRISA